MTRTSSLERTNTHTHTHRQTGQMLLTWQRPKAPTVQQYSCWTLTFNLNTGLTFSTKQPLSDALLSSLCSPDQELTVLGGASYACPTTADLKLPLTGVELFLFTGLPQIIRSSRTARKSASETNEWRPAKWCSAVTPRLLPGLRKSQNHSSLVFLETLAGDNSSWVRTLVERRANTQITFLECDLIIQ